jgi:hypothetical protein
MTGDSMGCVSSAVVRSLPPPGILRRHYGAGVLPRCSGHVVVGSSRPASVKVEEPPDEADAADKDVPNAKDAPDKDARTHACVHRGLNEGRV